MGEAEILVEQCTSSRLISSSTWMIHVECYRPHSVSHDDDGIDDWDARGILHDIDTQWGAMPHGGAYKESNTYYGSGDHDFY